MTQLDFTGPYEVLHRMPGAKAVTLWKNTQPIKANCGLIFTPSASIYDEVQYDMICVPGGFGYKDLIIDNDILEWLKTQSKGAELMTSVCTGSLVLGAAGLLRGYKAGCHWAWLSELPNYGAEPIRERVVIDRDRITAGGVTSGIDFGFRIIAERCGREIAEAIQLGLEYDPQPLAGGTPETAAPHLVEQLKSSLSTRQKQYRKQ